MRHAACLDQPALYRHAKDHGDNTEAEAGRSTVMLVVTVIVVILIHRVRDGRG